MFTGNFDDYLTDKKFTIIHMGDVIEHLLNPKKSLHKISTLLEPKGFLIIAVPNSSAFFQKISLIIARTLKLDWPHALPPAHTFQFSHRNICELVSNQGFSLLKTSFVNTSFMEEMRDTSYFQTIYNFIKKRDGTMLLFLKDSFLFFISGFIYFPFWGLGEILFRLGNQGSHMTLWFRKNN
jgi:predicted SAM-dependent methyltransferase